MYITKNDKKNTMTYTKYDNMPAIRHSESFWFMLYSLGINRTSNSKAMLTHQLWGTRASGIPNATPKPPLSPVQTNAASKSQGLGEGMISQDLSEIISSGAMNQPIPTLHRWLPTISYYDGNRKHGQYYNSCGSSPHLPIIYCKSIHQHPSIHPSICSSFHLSGFRYIYASDGFICRHLRKIQATLSNSIQALESWKHRCGLKRKHQKKHPEIENCKGQLAQPTC